MRMALFCIMAERKKHIHAQRSFRFLAQRHKTRTLAKRLVGERTYYVVFHSNQFILSWLC